MSQIYELKVKIDQIIDQKKLDPLKTKGEIGLYSGVLLALLRPETQDDPATIQKLKSAAQQVLREAI